MKKGSTVSLEQRQKISLSVKARHFPVGTKMSKTKFYRLWNSMRQRCENPNDAAYSRYGGRGIVVCNDWKDFYNFYCDMYESYKLGLTLERVDNSKGYSKDNCRWATYTEQGRNKRNNIRLTYLGKSLTLPEWSEITGIKRSTLSQRFHVYKWPVEKVLKEAGE